MNGGCIIAGAVCFIIAGLVGADYLATSINTDGSVMLATSGSDANGSFASRTLALDSAQVSRSFTGSDEMNADLSVRAAGPVLLSDYASGVLGQDEIRKLCTFLDMPSYQQTREASLFLSGIVDQGEYETSRTIGSGLAGISGVNGTGLMIFGSQGQGNRSLQSHGFVSGNMSVRDIVRYGGKL